MILSTFQYLVSILIPWYFGFRIMKFWNLSTSLRISFGFFVGFGLMSQFYFLIATLSTSFSIEPIYIFLISAIVGLYIWQRNDQTKLKAKTLEFVDNDWSSMHWINLLLILGIGLILFNIILLAIYLPIYSWDATATHAFKIKVFFLDQDTRHIHQVPHAAYPLYLSLSILWILQNVGFWHDQILKSFILLSSGFFLVVFYAFERLYVERIKALLGIFILLASPLVAKHMTIVYLDLSLAIINTLFFMILILLSERKLPRAEVLCALLTGLTVFVKMEGMIFAMVQSLLFISVLCFDHQLNIKKKLGKAITFFSLVGVFYGVMMFTKWVGGIPFSERSVFAWPSGQALNIIRNIAYFFSMEMLNYKNWNITWVIWLISLIIFRKNKATTILNAAIIISLLGYALMGLLNASVTRHFASPDSQFTLPRFYLHFFPLVVMSLVLGYNATVKNSGVKGLGS